MNFIADFHIHSKFSRATAANLDLENLYTAARIKGITVLGTGDFTHPAWWQEINEKLVPAEQGLFKLRDDIEAELDKTVQASCSGPVRFMLVTEISNIYKKADRTRKNHNLVFMPDLESAERFNRKLDAIGNIRSDGRPILGLDARNLLEIVLETNADGYLIPAHVWTPWFSLLGSKSGFDSVDACFEDLSPHIFALETGLSSDPPMNWRVSDLDRYTLISNSDAHSPAKLGREANLFDTALSYADIRKAIENPNENGFSGTLEFFPEEGKYHLDGHRKCSFRSLPEKTRKLDGICPVCNKPLTLGVLYRVEMLADRPAGSIKSGAVAYESLIPLEDVLSDIFKVGVKSKKVATAYSKLIRTVGCEFDILRTIPCDTLDRCGIPLLAASIERMRASRVQFDAGFDGEFGKVRLFDENERLVLQGQQCLFDSPTEEPTAEPKPQPPALCQAEKGADSVQKPESPKKSTVRKPENSKPATILKLNDEQQTVVDHDKGPLMIKAGPGTGKTRTITCRMAHLIRTSRTSSEHILAVTFTNKAAEEMRRRLEKELDAATPLPLITTFHGLCWRLLREIHQENQGAIADEVLRRDLIADAAALAISAGADITLKTDALLDGIIEAKQRLLGPDDDITCPGNGDAGQIKRVYTAYQELLTQLNLYDFEDLIMQCVLALKEDRQWRKAVQHRFACLFVDEFQDINYGQYTLLRLLAPPKADICVIGDPDQAIYGFRGSDVRYFNQFIDDYPKTRVLHLTRNYRSVETILKSSYQVIRNQTGSMDADGLRQRVYSNIKGHQTISILDCATARAEAVAIGKTIENMVGGTGFHAVDFGKVNGDESDSYSFGDMAVLFRTSEQGRLIGSVLTEAGIPCLSADSDAWRNNRAVAKLLALLRVLTDQGSFSDMKKLTDLISPGVGATSLDAFKTWAYAKQLDLSTALQTALRLPIPTISTNRQQRLAALVRRINTYRQQTSGMTAADTVSHLIETLNLNTDENSDSLASLTENARRYDTDLAFFLTAPALLSDTDLYRNEAERVSLLTMHAAKGLEFPIVFIAGCEQGFIPYHRNGGRACDLDEERRLFYVAMTRAEQRLYLSWSRNRTIHGKTVKRNLSPFCDDIEQRLKERMDQNSRYTSPKQEQLSLF